MIHRIPFILLLAFAGFAQKADPPLPDAKAFCHSMEDTKDAAMCTCATAYDGDLCKSDEPLPNFCKHMCGHAKDCHCCGLHK